MINLAEIEREIEELVSRRDTTYAVCEKLTYLYTVRDHLMPPTSREGADTPEISPLSGSEFLEACNGVPYAAIMKVIDEHMEAIKTFYPKEYDSLLAKIRALK